MLIPLALTLTLLQTPAPAPTPVSTPAPSAAPWIALTIGGQAFDGVTTCGFLHAGGREANPLIGAYPSCGKVLRLKGAVALGESVYIYFLNKRHPKLAKALGIFNGLVGLIAGYWNLTQTRLR